MGTFLGYTRLELLDWLLLAQDKKRWDTAHSIARLYTAIDALPGILRIYGKNISLYLTDCRRAEKFILANQCTPVGFPEPICDMCGSDLYTYNGNLRNNRIHFNYQGTQAIVCSEECKLTLLRTWAPTGSLRRIFRNITRKYFFTRRIASRDT